MGRIQTKNITLAEETARCKALHYRFAKRLSRIAISPGFETLSYTVKNGKKYYSEVWFEDGARKTKYYGAEENPEVRLIQEKHFLKKALAELDRHMEKLKVLEGLSRFECSKINDRLPKAYRMSEAHLKELEGPDEEERWYAYASAEKEEIERRQGVWYQGDRRHTAKDGTKMRSKSEVSIANEFFERGKPYIYEFPRDVGPFTLHPDFTFYSNRYGRVIHWEHAGLLGDPGYMEDFSRRVDTYISIGLVPCVDVIFTFDNINGDIDTRLIERLLDEYQ